MVRRMFAALVGSALLALPVSAQTTVLLQDDFSSWPLALGVGSAPPTSEWNIGGTVDIVADNTFGIRCAGNSGRCLDLDGTPGPGNLETTTFSFLTGDIVRFQFDVSGNQRGGAPDSFLAYLYFNNGPLSISSLSYQSDDGVWQDNAPQMLTGALGLVSNDPNWLIGSSYGWSTWFVQFTLGQDAEIGVGFLTTSDDNVGPLLDNVLLTRTTAVPEPSTYALMAAGLMAMAAVARRRRA